MRMKYNRKIAAKIFMVRDVTFPDLYVFLKTSLSELLQSLTNSPNLVQVSGHKVTNTNKPIPELTQTSREKHCTFCHFHFF